MLEKHSGEESKRISERLDENKKAEKTAIKNEEDRKNKKKRFLKGREQKEQKGIIEKALSDENMGKMIDVKR
jgi:hypothetical protein